MFGKIKIVMAIGIVCVILGGAIWYTTDHLSEIDANDSRFIGREAKAAANARRANRFVFEMNHALYRAIAEPGAETKNRYLAQLDKASPALKQLMDKLPGEAPSFAERIRPIASRVDRLIEDSAKVRALVKKGENAQALDLMHDTVDPHFKEIYTAAGALSTDIVTYLESGAAVLAGQTEATRTTALVVSGSGVVLSFAFAALIAIFGITRPMGRLERCSRGWLAARPISGFRRPGAATRLARLGGPSRTSGPWSPRRPPSRRRSRASPRRPPPPSDAAS